MPYDPDKHGPKRIVGPGFHDQVYRLVKKVPKGSVTTYGDIAKKLGLPTASRHVGWALAAIADGRCDVPWHRVVNGRGQVSERSDGDRPGEQEVLLEEEGVFLIGGVRVEGFASLRHRF